LSDHNQKEARSSLPLSLNPVLSKKDSEMNEHKEDRHKEIESSTNSPVAAPRQAEKRGSDVQRYTVDLDLDQRRTLSICSAEWEVDKSKVIRTLIYLLEADPKLRERVQSELFYDQDSESDDK
jgi:hypothetical protein